MLFQDTNDTRYARPPDELGEWLKRRFTRPVPIWPHGRLPADACDEHRVGSFDQSELSYSVQIALALLSQR